MWLAKGVARKRKLNISAVGMGDAAVLRSKSLPHLGLLMLMISGSKFAI